MTPRKERGALAHVGGHRQSKPGRTSEATSVRKDKTEKAKGAVEPDAEVKLKTTVVDIDSVREETKDGSIGQLEAAEQDGKRQRVVHFYLPHLWLFTLTEVVLGLCRSEAQEPGCV